jgi:hypothetical protein
VHVLADNLHAGEEFMPNEMTRPRIPPSRISKFDPRPMIVKGNFRSVLALSNAARSASFAGSAKKSAVPPTRNVVRFARGSSARTPVSAETATAQLFKKIGIGLGIHVGNNDSRTQCVRHFVRRFGDIACAQEQNEITRLNGAEHRRRDIGQGWNEFDGPASFPNRGSQHSAIRSGNFPFARRIHFSEKQLIRVGERLGELAHQLQRSRVAMRLKNHHQPARLRLFEGSQHGMDLIGMMSVIVEHTAVLVRKQLLLPPAAPRKSPRASAIAGGE